MTPRGRCTSTSRSIRRPTAPRSAASTGRGGRQSRRAARRAPPGSSSSRPRCRCGRRSGGGWRGGHSSPRCCCSSRVSPWAAGTRGARTRTFRRSSGWTTSGIRIRAGETARTRRAGSCSTTRPRARRCTASATAGSSTSSGHSAAGASPIPITCASCGSSSIHFPRAATRICYPSGSAAATTIRCRTGWPTSRARPATRDNCT